MQAKRPPREDIFVSVGVTGSFARPDAQAKLVALAEKLSNCFRFWEFLLIDNEDSAEAYDLATSVPHARLLKVRSSLPFFTRRLCIAREAIGNVVIITMMDEIDHVTIPDLVERSEAAGSIIVLRRGHAGMLNPFVIALGRSAGFRVDLRDMATVVFPRTLLDRLLRHPDVPLALRFMPIDKNLPIDMLHRPNASRNRTRSRIGMLADRLNIVRQLVISSAPRVLSIVELSSVLIGIAAFLFVIYVLVVWLTFDVVQPGWFTTSVLLSLVTMFLSMSIFGLATGLERLLAFASNGIGDEILDEVNAIDIFRDTMLQLNIDRDEMPDADAAVAARA